MIILLNGSINAGKTTVAKQLVQMLPRTAHVEVDDLREFIRFMPLEEAIPLNLQNAVAVTRNFVAYGLNVIVSYPLSQDDYDYLVRELQPMRRCLVTLNPDLTAALTNRGTRELTEWEMERIIQQSIVGGIIREGFLIDNTHQTPEETARQIVELVRQPIL